MAASLVQSIIAHSNAVSPVYIVNVPTPPTPGNLLVVMAGGQLGAPGATTCTITDNQGNTYTNLKLQSAAQCFSVIAACSNVISAGVFALIITYDQPQVHNNCVVQEFTGSLAALIADGSSASSGNNNGATQSCGTLTTANADDILLAFVINNGNSPLTETAPTGYTLDQTYLFQVGCASAYLVASATVNALVEFTTTDNTGQWNGITAAIQWQGGAALPEGRITALQAEFTALPESGSSAARIMAAQVESFGNAPTNARLMALQIEWFQGDPIPPPPIIPNIPGVPIVPGGGGGMGGGNNRGAYPVILPDPRIYCCWLGQQQKCVFHPTGERFQLLRYKVPVYDRRR